MQRLKRKMSHKVKTNIIYGKQVKTCTPSLPPCHSSPFLSSPSLESIIYSQLLHTALEFSDFPHHSPTPQSTSALSTKMWITIHPRPPFGEKTNLLKKITLMTS